jgi:hypothetical protein
VIKLKQNPRNKNKVFLFNLNSYLSSKSIIIPEKTLKSPYIALAKCEEVKAFIKAESGNFIVVANLKCDALLDRKKPDKK